MRLVRDPVAVRNERLRLIAGFVNALGLGLIGFALLRPLTEAGALVGVMPYLWTAAGLACHGAAHYVLAWLVKEDADDDVRDGGPGTGRRWRPRGRALGQAYRVETRRTRQGRR